MSVNSILSLVLPFVASLCISLALMPGLRRLADRNGWYDPPDLRKVHSQRITHLGGAGMFGAFVLTATVITAALRAPAWRPTVVLAGALILCVVGMIDDFRDLRALFRLVIHFLVAIAVTACGLVIRTIAIPGLGSIDLGILGYPVTVLWIAGVVNALNWVDGLDGYSGGISAVAALFLGVLAFLNGHLLTAAVALALFGVLVGYLVFNFPPARIFMGDAGATFVGFTLAVLPLLNADSAGEGRMIVAAAFLLIIPLAEILTSVARRIGQGRHPGSPDRGHIHFVLGEMGWSPRRTLVVVYPLCCIFGILALLALGPWTSLPAALPALALLAGLLLAVGFTWWALNHGALFRGPSREPRPSRGDSPS